MGNNTKQFVSITVFTLSEPISRRANSYTLSHKPKTNARKKKISTLKTKFTYEFHTDIF